MRILGAILFAALTSFAAPAAAQDATLAAQAASELRQMCDADRARLWGVDLCGPLLVVDPTSRAAWGSQPDQDQVLSFQGAGWAGILPEGAPVANMSVEWAGVRWIMVMAPLPENETDRRVLVAHEAWHRAQDSLGLPQQHSDCAHLETERGRYLLRLEFRALATALRSRGAARRSAARDALTFRAVRLAEFPGAAEQEAALDRNEGLASYTGVKLGAGEGAEMFAARTLDRHDRHEAYARSYAYASGPAYGLLLDEIQPVWRSALGARTPADLLVPQLRPEAYEPARFYRLATRYGGPMIGAEELTRAQAQRARITEMRERFGEGPRLAVAIRRMQMEFDPNQVTPVDGLGNLYGVLTVRDAWGELRATEGALISSDFTSIILAAPNPSGLSGPGWTIVPTAGARVRGPDRTGLLTLSAP